MMSFMVNPYVFKAAGPSGPASVTYIGGKTGSSTNTVTYPITGVQLGTGDGLVVIAVSYTVFADATTLLSATIAGVPAKILIQSAGTYTTAGRNGIAFISARIPAGTTSGTVVLNFSAIGRAYVGVFRAEQLSQDTPTSTAGSAFSTTSSKSISLGVQAGGFIIAASGLYSKLGVSLSAGVAGKYNTVWFNAEFRAIAGMYSAASDEASRTITLTRQYDGFAMSGALAAVSFR